MLPIWKIYRKLRLDKNSLAKRRKKQVSIGGEWASEERLVAEQTLKRKTGKLECQ